MSSRSRKRHKRADQTRVFRYALLVILTLAVLVIGASYLGSLQGNP